MKKSLRAMGFIMSAILFGVLLAFLMNPVGCASLQDKWDRLTPNEQAAVILGGMQDELDALLDGGISYIQANPQHEAVWKERVLPAIEIANHALKDAIILSQTEGVTPEYVYMTVSPLIKEVVALLALWGVTAEAERGYIT